MVLACWVPMLRCGVISSMVLAGFNICPVLAVFNAVMRVGVMLDCSIVAGVVALSKACVVLSSWGSVVSWLVMDSLCVMAGVFRLVFDGLVSVSLVRALVVAVLELVSVGSLVLGVAVMAITSVLGLSVRVLTFCVMVGAVVDKRSLVSVTIDVFMMGNNLVSNDFVSRDCMSDWNTMVGNDGSLMVANDSSLMMDNRGLMVRCLGLVVFFHSMGVLMDGFLVVNDLVVCWEVAGVSIIVVHLEDKVAIFDVNLAAHEKRGVVLETPIVASVPFLGVKGVEVVSPSQGEVFLVNVVVVDLDEVVLGVPGHLGVIEIVVPWRPDRSPEVHHELSVVLEEVNILGALSLSDELVIDVPADVVGSPLNGVGEPVGLGVETGGVVMVLSAIFPDNVHGEGVLGHRRYNFDIDLVPAMRPVLSCVCEEGLNSSHLVRVLHLSDELSVLEPFLGSNLTRKVVGLSNASKGESCELLHL